ncbi:MAG: nucleotidyltransferase family protein [Candidatus Schekmanbacteria bacterium]|nr:nucleotidyltransferase family protein [Candidatus Schekmanbacteria bacterium]
MPHILLPTSSELALVLAAARAVAGVPAPDGLRAQVERRPPDPAALVSVASAHGMLPLLGAYLGDHPELSVSAAARATVARQRRCHTARNLLLAAELVRLVAAFERAGISALCYKGPVLAMAVYGSLALRQIRDLDLLVHPHDVIAARQVLRAAGYATKVELPRRWDWLYRQTYHEQPFVSGANAVFVDLHWRLTPPHFSLPLRFEDVARRGTAVAVGSAGAAAVPAPSALDSALIHAVHGSYHLWSRLEWVAVMGAYCARRLPLDWAAAVSLARQIGAERFLALGAWTAHHLLETPVPPELYWETRRWPAVSEHAVAAARRTLEQANLSALAAVLELQRLQLQLPSRCWRRLRFMLLRPLQLTPEDWLPSADSHVPTVLHAPVRLLRLARKYAKRAWRRV